MAHVFVVRGVTNGLIHRELVLRLLSQLVELLLRQLLCLDLNLLQLFLFQGSLEFSALGWRGVLQEALHEDAGCVRVPIELQLAFSVELNLLGNEEVIGKL